MTIYDRKCNATRYLEIKRFERVEKKKTIKAYLWLVTGMGLYMCLMLQIMRAAI